ncbi:MFS transporter [Streptomyces sp. LBUM 1476]|nr:MFS transporter [Streptomyces sp. LBUM 1476]MBZ3916753.1 MFS transporter [Streptomyces acidiscabies]
MLAGYFALLGTVMAVWGARIPDVQHAAGLDTAGLALVLLAAAAGMVTGLRAGARLVTPARRPLLLTGCALGLAAALAVLGLCRTPAQLLAVGLVFGVLHGIMDVAANTAAVDVQAALGRPVMSSLHAAYSLGALTGAGYAALAGHTSDTSHTWLFAATATAVACAAAAMAPAAHVLGAVKPPSTAETAPSRQGLAQAWPRGRVWLLGGLAAGCLLAEGTAADWASVHLHGLHATTAVSSAAYALYAAAMAAGRLTGDTLTARVGAPTVVRAGALLAAGGLTAGLAAGTVPAALTGWAALGLGLSVTVPSLITAAGHGGPRAVAAVSVTGYAGLLAGPALIGALATATTLPAALMLPALLAVLVAALSHHALEHPAP